MQKKQQCQHIFNIHFEDNLFRHSYLVQMGLDDFFSVLRKPEHQDKSIHRSEFLMDMKRNGGVFQSENGVHGFQVFNRETGKPVHQAHYDNRRLIEYMLYDNNGEITCHESFAEELPQNNKACLSGAMPTE